MVLDWQTIGKRFGSISKPLQTAKGTLFGHGVMKGRKE